ncbi:MAG: DUF4469 domain-containing protein [Prevotellaceae bacterium]|jgi:hypothetical protein|nr:DUF4469 domain-containing protein [Prevotellaceae bacterium]
MTTIKAVAHPNGLSKSAKKDFYLLPKTRGTLHTKDIIARLEKKQIATKNVNGESFVLTFMEECVSAVKEGYNVVTYMHRMYMSLNGTVTTESLGHNLPAGQVEARVQFTQGIAVRKELDDVTVYVEEQPAAAGPVIQAVCNPSENIPDTLNTNSMVMVQGLRLIVRGDATEEIGVFFTTADEEINVKVSPEDIMPNTSTKLQFVLPSEVTAGKWKITLATQGTHNHTYHTKDVRRFEYPGLITVV